MGNPDLADFQEVDSLKSGQDRPGQSAEDQQKDEHHQWQELLQERRLALAKDPKNVQLLNEVGEVAEKAGDLDRASWAYKRAIRIDPNYAISHRNLGQLFQRQGRTEQATVALQNYYSCAGDEADLDSTMKEFLGVAGDAGNHITQLCTESPICKKLARKWGELGLTPAEALYLLDPKNSSGREMMQYTLLDMIMRDVLEIDENNGVGRGEVFDMSELRPHEKLYARYFSKFEDQINIDRLAGSVATQLHRRFDQYKINYVRRSLVENGYIQEESVRVRGIIPVQRYVLTDSGQRAINQLKRLMKKTGAQIDRALKSNPQQARAFFAEGGPAILLMESHRSGFYKEWLAILDQIGLGSAVRRAGSRLQGSTAANITEEVIKTLFSQIT
jgi:tetratricopeptide (TPR) repeat protein